MNLYLVERRDDTDFIEYDSVVVAAETEADARKIHPSGEMVWSEEVRKTWAYDARWPVTPGEVQVKHIGIAVEGTEQGVVLASFNAG